MSKTKTRGNGTGTAFRRGRTWTAKVTVGYKESPDGSHLIQIRRTKGGFATRKDALNYCAALMTAGPAKKNMTLQEVYDAWEPFYSPRVGQSCMDNYYYAYKHFAPLHNTFIHLITALDLQNCMDQCPAGKRTHENMRCVAGLLWAYALDREIVTRDITANLYTGNGETVQREPLTEDEVKVIREQVGKMPYADYVYALCYLGFRPTEFLSLKKTDLSIVKGQLVLTGGSKTPAGIDRTVAVPPIIGDIIARQMRTKDTDLLFPRAVWSHHAVPRFKGWAQMSHSYFREFIFKPMMKKLNIAEGKVPYCARHTYSDKLKNAKGPDKAKASQMGHTDYAFTQSHYQSNTIEDLKKIAMSIQ